MRPGSLTGRIAALLLAAAAAVFALTAIGLEQVVNRELVQRDAGELAGKIGQLRHLLRERPDIAAVAANPHPFADVIVGHDGLGFALWDADGQRLLQAGAAIDVVSGQAPPTAVPADRAASAQDVKFVEKGRLHWRLLAADAYLASGQTVRVLIGRDVHASVDMRSTYRKVMVAGSLVAAFGTALIGWLAVWRGIRPLADVVQAASRITAHRLTERVNVPPTAAREIQELGDAFNRMVDRLEEAFTRLTRFSADLAHDLRTPLATLLLQTQVGLSRARSAEEYQGLLEANIQEFERLQRMVDAMLFLARADNAQIALKREPVDLQAELARLAEYFELTAEEHGVRITTAGAATLAADVALLRRAVGNLVSNAIRHARSGSTITLSARTDGSHVTIDVANEGEPIAAPDLDKVFDRFWRGDRSRSASEHSSGLGLSIVRSIVTLHGGQATVRSGPDGLTVFSLRLPARVANP